MKQIRIGLIGTGFMGKTHLCSVRNLPFYYKTAELGYTAEVAAVCASSLPHAEAFAAEYGIPRAVATPEEILADPTIDVVDICTPNPLHFEVAKAAILAGKAVLCEKPLTVTAAEAEELAALAEERGVICGTVFNNRFLAPVMRARQLIDEGKLGRILGFEFTYKHNSCIDPDRRVGWKQTAEFGGGTWYDLGPHVVDLCRYLCGDLSGLIGRAQIAYPTHLKADGSLWQTDADEAFFLIATTAAGATGTITVSKLVQGANDELTFSVNGERGSLSFSLMDPNFLNFYDATALGAPMGGVRGYTRIECVGRYPSPASGFPAIKAPQGWLRGHIGCIAAYLSAMANGTACSPSFADGAYVQRILEAALESDRTGREVKLC
jgi:predicted dehydrogenase